MSTCVQPGFLLGSVMLIFLVFCVVFCIVLFCLSSYCVLCAQSVFSLFSLDSPSVFSNFYLELLFPNGTWIFNAICVMFFFMCNDWRCNVVACFVDIGGIVDYDYLNFLSMTKAQISRICSLRRDHTSAYRLHWIHTLQSSQVLPWYLDPGTQTHLLHTHSPLSGPPHSDWKIR